VIRQPAVAGRFYPSDPEELALQIDGFVSFGAAPAASKVRASACLVPHAGYTYSGRVAGAVYAAMEIPSRCILLGPRHYPRGEPLAILTEGSFSTPFGNAPIDSQLAHKLAHAFPKLREDALAHETEHSLEVQLPFLQHLVKDLRFVPVVLATDRYGVLEELGQALAQVLAAEEERVLIVASSDMNHYENDGVTRTKDERAVRQILALDPRGLYDTVRNEGISMCGYAATVVMLEAVRQLRKMVPGTSGLTGDATEPLLVSYATSGDVNGDRERVVGYAGIVIP
jgi:AmmeMemoRadiSam system protein B